MRQCLNQTINIEIFDVIWNNCQVNLTCDIFLFFFHKQEEQKSIEGILSDIKRHADELSTSPQESLQKEIKINLLKLVELWSTIISNINEVNSKRGQRERELADFKQLAYHLYHWIEETKSRLEEIDRQIKSSNVEKLKICFHHVSVRFLFLRSN